MRIIPALMICFITTLILVSCRSNDKVILLEERDPIIKTLTEKDSLVVYPRDTIKKEAPEETN